MIRVQIKDESLRLRLFIDLIEKQYKINITNKNGDCFYIWTDRNGRRCDISHWTDDNPILEIDNKNYLWLKNCL